MPAFAATIRQAGSSQWVFEPPDRAPLKSRCHAFDLTVAMRRPHRVADRRPGHPSVVRLCLPGLWGGDGQRCAHTHQISL